MMDVAGLTLTSEDKELLTHPYVGGIILFTRNYENRAQLSQLIGEIRACKGNDILIGVDHEGGRVQRFRREFTELPSMHRLIEYAQDDVSRAKEHAVQMGWLMAAELRAMDIDFSFAPVLDVYSDSRVIGDRSFHQDPKHITEISAGFIEGMQKAGMPSTGKHFPGHGSVLEDSHVELPVDTRSLAEIKNHDMKPFSDLIKADSLDAVMPAHVIYSQVDDKPAGFSSVWTQQILRNELGFDGVIFSDDLGMHGASVAGDDLQRATAALTAGCDMILVCNNRDAVKVVLENYQSLPIVSPNRLSSFCCYPSDYQDYNSLKSTLQWRNAAELALAIRK